MKGRAAWVLVGGLMLAMILVMLWKWPSDSGQWASWAQAIGTVAALFGVLWIAHADERRRREEQLANAAVTAAILLRVMPELIGVVTVTIDRLRRIRPDQGMHARMEVLCASLDNAPLPSEEQMLRVIPISAALGQTLAHAVGQVTQAQAVFGMVMLNPEDELGEIRSGVDIVASFLRSALEGLQWCGTELDRFNTAASVPPAASTATKQKPP